MYLKMEREIKFRGYGIKGWVYGSLLKEVDIDHIDYYIVDPEDLSIKYAVDRDSVGEYTGLFDYSGEEIYEGQYLKLESGIPEFDREFCVCYDPDFCRFCLTVEDEAGSIDLTKRFVKEKKLKVINDENYTDF